jgi:hypothetical protein
LKKTKRRGTKKRREEKRREEKRREEKKGKLLSLQEIHFARYDNPNPRMTAGD